MADEQTKLIYQAELDNGAVLASIDEMRKKAGEFEKQGDAAMAKYGKRVDDTAKQLKTLADNLALGGETGKKAGKKLTDFFDTSVTGAKQFRTQLARMLKDIQAVGDIKEGAGVLDFDKLFGGDVKGKAAREILIKVIGTEEAEQKIKQLRSVTDTLMSSIDDSAKVIGTHLRALGESFYESFKSGGKGVDEANAKLKEFITSAKQAKAQSESFADVTVKPLKTENMKQKLDELGKIATNFLISADSEVQDFGANTLQALIDIENKWQEQPGDIESVQQAIRKVSSEVNQYNRGLEEAVKTTAQLRAEQEKEVKQQAVEPVQLVNALVDIRELKEKAKEFTDSATEEGKKFGKQMTKSLEDVMKAFDDDKISADALAGSVKGISAEAAKFEKRVSSMSKEDVDLNKKLNAHKAEAAIKQLDDTIENMTKSTSSEVRDASTTFKQLRDQIKKAAEDPKADMNALVKKTKELNRAANDLGNTYEDKVARGSDKATISAWKMGHALDRVGIRGAGGIIRIVDAFKGIPAGAIAAVAAVAGVALALKALITVIVELEKRAIKAFLDITKQAVVVSQSFELTERQLTNVFKGQVDIAKHTLDRILALSVDFGVDLTGEVAKIFLPLVENFAQFEEISEIVSTLAIGFGKTTEEAGKALKQMQAGRSRALLDLGLLASDIKIIKAEQERIGETAGLISGMQKFFVRSGQNWDTYKSTLQRVLGSLDILKKKLLLTFGEPIKNEIVEQLQKIIQWVEDNEAIINAFLARIGNAVSDVVGFLGGGISNFLGDLDVETLVKFEQAFIDIKEAIEIVFNQLTEPSGEDGLNPIIDAALTLLGIIEKTIYLVGDLIEKVVQLTHVGDKINEMLTGGTAAENWMSAFKRGIEDGKDLQRVLQEELEHWADQQPWRYAPESISRETLQEIIDGLILMGLSVKEAEEMMNKLGYATEGLIRQDLEAELRADIAATKESTKALEARADATLKASAATQEFMTTQQEYLEQVDEVREAERALNEEMQNRFSEIFVATMATDIDDRIAEVGERIRIEQEKIANLETLEWKIINIDAMDLDTVAEFGKIQIAGLQKDIDDTLEYITSQRGKMSEEELRRLQMEIDFKRKLIQLEQDHIDKIAALQTKRQEDEIDAQTDYDRREDSIRIKAARREIEMELDHSRAVERMEQAHQNRLREIRMRADFDAQEAIRMNDAVALLRIRRRMDFDIKMAEDKNKEQKQNAGVDAQDRRAKLARQLQYELDDLDTAHDQKLEDIATNFKRQLTLIEENYQKQLRAQAEQEKQKREDMLIWLKTELDDFNASWDEKNAALKVKWQDFYDIEKKYIGMVIEQRKRILSFNPQIGPWAGGFGAQYDPNSGIGSWFGNGGGGGGGGQGPPDYPNNDADGVSETLRRAVTNLLNRLVTQGANLDPDARTWGFRIINAISNNELRTIENQLRAQGVGGPGMQHGGQANVGQRYTVGEMGPEPFHPTKAGIIQPTQREYMPIGSPPIQNISTDNSRRIDAPISMLDPTYMSPVQITMIRGIVTEEILKSAI